jgi:predicted Zn-dependent protease
MIMKFKNLALASAIVAIAGCTQNAATGRKQLNLVSSQDMLSSSLTEYTKFLQQSKVVNNTQQSEMVKRIGARIAAAVSQYYTSKGQAAILEGYKWEYNLVESKDVNAWCMPGGKIVVYTGILPVTQNEAALAVVMGHEVAHAVAEHGRERASQSLIQQYGGAALSVALSSKPAETQNMLLNAFGIASNYGFALPFSRKQELEADKLGLMYCAMAGYDPQESVPLWERMQKLSAGNSTPEFASTHPAESTRIAKLRELMPEAMVYYNKAKGSK